jgi:hypothetical protein
MKRPKLAFRPTTAKEQTRSATHHRLSPSSRTSTRTDGGEIHTEKHFSEDADCCPDSASNTPTMSSPMRSRHPIPAHVASLPRNRPGYRSLDTIPPILISGTNEYVIIAPEDSGHTPQVMRPAQRQIFSSRLEEGRTHVAEEPVKTTASAASGKAASSAARKSRPNEWT